MRVVIKTLREQQRLDGPGPYSFRRNTLAPKATLNLCGYGHALKPCGLIASGCRPSDDACIFPFLIPSNLFAVTALENLAELASGLADFELTKQAKALSDEVRAALRKYGTADHRGYGAIYAYEADGYPNQFFINDPHLPSLLSLPYLGCV